MLISHRWISGEAAERGIVVTPAEVRRALREQRDQSFPRRARVPAVPARLGPDARERPLPRPARPAVHSGCASRRRPAPRSPEEQQDAARGRVRARRSGVKWRARDDAAWRPGSATFDCQRAATQAWRPRSTCWRARPARRSRRRVALTLPRSTRSVLEASRRCPRACCCRTAGGRGRRARPCDDLRPRGRATRRVNADEWDPLLGALDAFEPRRDVHRARPACPPGAAAARRAQSARARRSPISSIAAAAEQPRPRQCSTTTPTSTPSQPSPGQRCQWVVPAGTRVVSVSRRRAAAARDAGRPGRSSCPRPSRGRARRRPRRSARAASAMPSPSAATPHDAVRRSGAPSGVTTSLRSIAARSRSASAVVAARSPCDDDGELLAAVAGGLVGRAADAAQAGAERLAARGRR